jgi:hypothetical protein
MQKTKKKARKERKGNEARTERIANSSRFLAGTRWEAPSC